jgi:hypothetical protein
MSTPAARRRPASADTAIVAEGSMRLMRLLRDMELVLIEAIGFF